MGFAGVVGSKPGRPPAVVGRVVSVWTGVAIGGVSCAGDVVGGLVVGGPVGLVVGVRT